MNDENLFDALKRIRMNPIPVYKKKVRLDWAAQNSAIAQMNRREIANMAFRKAAQKFIEQNGIKDLAEETAKQALGITTSDYAYIADFARRLIYKHTDDLSWVTRTLGQAPLQTLDVTVEFNSGTELTGPIDEADAGDRTVLTWTKYEIRLQKYVGRFLVTDAARARGRSNIQATWTLKNLAEQLNQKKERHSIDELYAMKGATAVAATAAWNSSSATMEQDVNAAIGNILNETDSLPPKGLRMVLLVPASVWPFVSAQQATLNLSVLDHFKKTLRSFDVIPTKYWHESSAIGIGDDALLYVPGSGTAIHGFTQNAPFPLSERVRKPAVGWEYFFQQWFRSVVTPDSKSTTTSSRICAITGVE